MADERVAKARSHARIEQTETCFLLPSHFTVRPQQVFQRKNSDDQRSCRKDDDTTTITDMFQEADDKLFSRVLTNDNHELQQYLTDRTSTQYNIRTREHNKTLISKTTQ